MTKDIAIEEAVPFLGSDWFDPLVAGVRQQIRSFIEGMLEEFKRRIKTQCMLPCAETACMLFWALLASGQITLRKVDGWQTLHIAPAEQQLDLVA